jgi:hypothetical protein
MSKKCDCCGDTIKTPGEDPDLCQECCEDIFSQPGRTFSLTTFSDLVSDEEAEDNG